MIPENKRNIVENALQSAFGVKICDEIEEMTKGLSNALTYRIVVKGKPYLLKIARTDELSAPARYYEYMKAGAQAGIAPKVWHLDAQDKISITDFIESKPFPISKAKEAMPKLLRKLHELPPFHKAVNYVDAMDGMVKRFHSKKFIPSDIADDLIKNYTRIKNVYPFSSDEQVSCHNDLKPENFIFDGENVWLVDWEAAFLNDRCFDLSIVANFVVKNDEDETQYLRSYFGKEPDKYMKARFFLTRQLLHVFYMATFMLFASGSVSIEEETAPAIFSDFHDHMWEGDIDLSNDKNKLQYALVHMNRFLSNISDKRFEDSLRIVSENQ